MSVRTGQNWSYQADVTSAELNSLPQGWTGRTRVTSGNQTGITTETVLTEFTTSPTVEGTDRALWCRAVVQVETGTGTGGSDIFAIVRIREGGLTGTVIAYASEVVREDTVTTTVRADGCDFSVNGAVAYYVTLEIAGVDTLDTVHSTSKPGELLIVDLGPSS